MEKVIENIGEENIRYAYEIREIFDGPREYDEEDVRDFFLDLADYLELTGRFCAYYSDWSKALIDGLYKLS